MSWRVHILPFIEQQKLYEQFVLDEPWNGPNNRKLLPLMPRTYQNPREGNDPPGFTRYRGFAQPGAILEKRPTVKVIDGIRYPLGPTIKECLDGLMNTILLVEAGEPVEWTKPDDFDVQEGRPFPTMGGITSESNVCQALFADGSVRALRHPVSETMLRRAITFAGGEVLPVE